MGVWGSISNPAGYLQDIVVDAVNGQVALTLADSELSNSADVITVPFSQVVDAVGNATVNSATPANTVLTITRSTGGPTTRRWGATWGP